MTGYPLVKDTLSTAHAYVEERPYLSSLYQRAEALSLALLHRLEPLQRRLPLEQVDSYANAGLDYLEKKVPQVKLETGELIGQARKPPTPPTASPRTTTRRSTRCVSGARLSSCPVASVAILSGTRD